MKNLPAKIDKIINRATADVIVRDDLIAKLQSGKKLRIKLGIDPTKPDLHLGHAVPLRKLKHFQDAGHQIILLFGGFTATIGDPTGKNEARPPLTLDQTEQNAKEYLRQAGKILDMSKVELRNNREWLENMKPQDFITLMGSFTTAQMLERDMFAKRIKEGAPIYCHEILYPMLQGYDSVPLKADVEIGGTDQLFNLLTGRPIQKIHNLTPQNVLTVPLIEGLDGKEKMSKSLGNYVSLDETPEDMYGKLMKVPDELMAKYFECLTDLEEEMYEKEIQNDPRKAKGLLAFEITKELQGEAAAKQGETDFVNKFIKKDLTENIKEVKIAEDLGIIEIVKLANANLSNSEARRLVTQGAVSLEGQKITELVENLEFESGNVLKVGKKTFLRLLK